MDNNRVCRFFHCIRLLWSAVCVIQKVKVKTIHLMFSKYLCADCGAHCKHSQLWLPNELSRPHGDTFGLGPRSGWARRGMAEENASSSSPEADWKNIARKEDGAWTPWWRLWLVLSWHRYKHTEKAPNLMAARMSLYQTSSVMCIWMLL